MKFLILFILLLGVCCASKKSVTDLQNEFDGLRYEFRMLRDTVHQIKHDAGPTWEMK